MPTLATLTTLAVFTLVTVMPVFGVVFTLLITAHVSILLSSRLRRDKPYPG
jgi:hypothetical protein